MYGIACINDGSQERKKPDVIFCDQISACIPFLKEVPILSWLLPYSPKVITLIYLNYEPWIGRLLTPKLRVFKNILSHFYV